VSFLCVTSFKATINFVILCIQLCPCACPCVRLCDAARTSTAPRCTEVELVERAGVTTEQAQDLRRLAFQHHSAALSESRSRGGSGSSGGGNGGGGPPQRVVGFRETPAFAPWLRSGSADQVHELQPYTDDAQPQSESPPTLEEDKAIPTSEVVSSSPSKDVLPPSEAASTSETQEATSGATSNANKTDTADPVGAPPELLPFPATPRPATDGGDATSSPTVKSPPTTSLSPPSKPPSTSSNVKPTSPRAKLTPVPRAKKHSLPSTPSSPPPPLAPLSPRSSPPASSSKSYFASGTLRGAKAGRAATFNEATDIVSSVQ